jgi:hypothetical protein
MIIAKTIGQSFLEECKNGANGVVHSVFRRAVNFKINHSGEIFTITLGEIDHFTTNCACENFSADLLDIFYVNQRIILTPTVILLDETPCIGSISLANVWNRLTNEEIRQFSSFINKQSFEILPFLKSQLIHKAKFLDANITRHISELQIENLIGLGDGLTPSGDDFLVGVIHGYHFLEILTNSENNEFNDLKNKVRELIKNTGTISQHFISHALNKQWGSNTEGILCAIVQNDLEKLLFNLNRKFSIGASSGYDETFGIVYAFEHFFDLV